MVEKNLSGDVQEEALIPPTAGTDNESAETSTDPNEEIIEIINRFVPDADTSTPEGIIASALTALKSMVAIYDKVYDVALTAPESAGFIRDLLDTGDVAKSLARNYDPEELEAMMGEVKDDSYEQDRSTHTEKVTTAKTRMDKVKGNLDISMQAIAKFQEDRKHWPSEKAEAFEKFVIQHYDDGADGLITEKDLALLEKGFNYDTDVTEAEENGKVMGRNEQIETKKADKKELENLLPEHASGMAPTPPAPVKKRSFAGDFMKDI